MAISLLIPPLISFRIVGSAQHAAPQKICLKKLRFSYSLFMGRMVNSFQGLIVLDRLSNQVKIFLVKGPDRFGWVS